MGRVSTVWTPSLDEPFSIGVMESPSGVNCRCAVTYKATDFLNYFLYLITISLPENLSKYVKSALLILIIKDTTNDL